MEAWSGSTGPTVHGSPSMRTSGARRENRLNRKGERAMTTSQPRAEADYMRYVKALSVDIGPRGSTTVAEKKAADYIAQEMRGWADEVRVEGFRSFTSFSWPFGLLYLLSAIVGLLNWYDPGLALAVSALATLLFLKQTNGTWSIGFLFPQRDSQNVVGIIRPTGEATRRVIITAHHDSSKSALLFAPNLVAGFRRSFLLMAASIFILPAVAVLGMFAWSPSRYLALPFAAYLIISFLFIVHRELFGRYTPGANDNASGVAVMLGLGEHFGKEPPTSTEIWMVSTGCEEVGMVGMIEFLKTHGSELKDAYFINLDNVGAGQAKWTTAEGMLTLYHCDQELVAMAEKSAGRHPEWGMTGVTNTIMSTDIGPALARGFKGISVRAEDPNRVLPNWHWHTDTYDNVEPKTLEIAGKLVREMVEMIDAGG